MTEVVVTLVQLAFVATILTVALEQIYDTDFYEKYFGKGLDGKGSKFFPNFDLRPWIATAVGIFLAFGFKFQALQSGLAIQKSEGFLGNEAGAVDMFLTGLIIGGGTKTVVKIAKRYRAAKADIEGNAQQGRGDTE